MFRYTVRRKYVYLLIASIVLGGSVAAMRYSDVFRLKTVVLKPVNQALNGVSATNPNSGNIFEISLDSLADELLHHKNVVKVDITYDLPDKLVVSLNQVKPLAFVLSNDGEHLYQMDINGFVVPLSESTTDFEAPILTGVKGIKLFEQPNDYRVPVLLEQLRRLKTECIDFYLAISDINLSREDRIILFIDGLPCPVEAYIGTLCPSIKRLEVFLKEFDLDLQGVKKIDLRTEGLIVTES